MKPRVVIVDDEERMAGVVAAALGRAGYECVQCASGDAALAALEERPADVVVTDWKMPGMDGLTLLRSLRARWPATPVVLLTAYGSVPSAVAAMREGAFDFVTKPFDNDELRALVARALDLTRLERENRYLRQEVASRYAPDATVAESEASRKLLDLVRRVAPSRATVLIQGESGTGKELVARLLHYWSDRVGHPFVAVNCKAFAEGVLESELFGHERGAFTGAVAARPGCFERASGGTLFLDEIGEIGADFQAKLLRVLQDGEVLPVGGTRPRRVDVRVVTARRLALAPEAEDALVAHAWPGNVRELENALERAVVLAHGERITPEDLLLEQRAASADGAPEGTLQDALDRAAAARISSALEVAKGNRAEAARALGVDRTTLYRLMKRLGLSPLIVSGGGTAGPG